MESKVMGVIEEQVAVRFTGKVNVLASFNRQFLGHILFKDGDIIQVTFNSYKGLKAFYQLLIQEYSLNSFDYVVEPELVEEEQRQIHYPFSVIKNKLGDVLKQYRESLKMRPPENVKILIDAEFLEDTLPVTAEEFDVLKALTEWNNPYEIYQHCELLDHEITWALVSLRKKGALKIIAPKGSVVDG
ncbi:MAG: hypothetical protein NDI69_09395 [Bacteriovoracaceae bacterium]|nr:hypothetical protein [Bacteriovoracaceae bacterium]